MVDRMPSCYEMMRPAPPPFSFSDLFSTSGSDEFQQLPLLSHLDRILECTPSSFISLFEAALISPPVGRPRNDMEEKTVDRGRVGYSFHRPRSLVAPERLRLSKKSGSVKEGFSLVLAARPPIGRLYPSTPARLVDPFSFRVHPQFSPSPPEDDSIRELTLPQTMPQRSDYPFSRFARDLNLDC